MLLQWFFLLSIVTILLHLEASAIPAQRDLKPTSGIRRSAITQITRQLPYTQKELESIDENLRRDLAEIAERDGADEEKPATDQDNKDDGNGTTEGDGDTVTGDDSTSADEGNDGDSGDTTTSGDENPPADGSAVDGRDMTKPEDDGDGSDDDGNGDSKEESDTDKEPTGEDDTSTDGTKDDKKDPGGTGNDLGKSAGAGNETEAFMSFVLNIIVESSDSSDSFVTEKVFEKGALVGKFAKNPSKADASSIPEDETSSWYNEGPYSDRITFQIVTSPELDDYKIAQPTIGFGSDAGINPELKSFTYEDSEGIGTFTIIYACKAGGPEKNAISLHIPITENHSVDTTWMKTCGSGRNEHINLGFLTSDNKLTLFNADGTYGTEEAHTLEVGPLQQSTDLKAVLTEPQWQLGFNAPYVQSDNPQVRVALRGTIQGGELSTDEEKTFSVLYFQCEETTARANIMFTFAIPPWENVTARWRKDCGGSHSQALLIGTTSAGSFEVMQDGELDERYNVTESTSLNQAFGSVEEIKEDQQSTRFYLTNSDDTSDIHIQTIALTMSNPEVLSTYIEVPFAGSGNYIPAGGATIGRKETKSLRVHFICKKLGESIVLITLPIVKYKNVEFGFIKRCAEPKAQHHSGFLRTAGSITGTIIFLSIVIGIWIYLRRRPSTKYERVATNERGP